MTPKEKAKTLIDKFKGYSFNNFDNDATEQRTDNAKKCAIILVDEILEYIGEIATIEYHFGKSIAYWKDVKDEIKEFIN